MKKKNTFEALTPEGALRWMIHEELVIKKTTKDPETYATVQGFILSDQLRELIGSNLVKLVAKATKGRKGARVRESVRDAFLTASMAGVLEMTRASLSDDEMTTCANIIFSLLPIGRLEEAGLADRSLRAVARDKASVEKLQNLFGQRRYSTM